MKIKKRTNRILLLSVCLGVFSLSLFAQFKTASAKMADQRVAKAFGELKIEYTVKKDGSYEVTYDVGDKRTQMATVLSETDQIYGIETRCIFSYAAFSKTPFSQEITSQVLAENMEHVSAWSVVKIDKGFTLVNVIFISADADAKRLDAAITSVVLQADKMEEKLMKEDKL